VTLIPVEKRPWDFAAATYFELICLAAWANHGNCQYANDKSDV